MITSKNIDKFKELDVNYIIFKQCFSNFLENEIVDSLQIWQIRLAISDVLNEFLMKYRRKNE